MLRFFVKKCHQHSYKSNIEIDYVSDEHNTKINDETILDIKFI